ncbi:MAG TPA: SRPBCC family protein [Drouetiella sp.]
MKLISLPSKTALCLIATLTISGTLTGSSICSAKEPKEAKLNSSAESPAGNAGSENSEQKKRLARSTSCFEVAAPREVIWQTLTNFPKYPDLFKRIKTCRVTKREGDLVFIESMMKSQLFIKPCQHTINDLGKGPGTLKWKLLDGNFKSVEGIWTLEPVKDADHTKVTYTIEVDPGIVPQGICSMFMKAIQKEAVTSVTSVSESFFAERRAANEHATNNKG